MPTTMERTTADLVKSLERDVDELVDGLERDLTKIGNMPDDGEPTSSGEPISSGKPTSSSGIPGMSGAMGSKPSGDAPGSGSDNFPYSAKRPRWKGLRGIGRWLWKGYSPDNPDYQHLYSPNERSKFEPKWKDSDRSKWSKPNWGGKKEHLSLEEYRELTRDIDVLAEEIISDVVVWEEDSGNKYTKIMARLHQFRVDLKRLVGKYVRISQGETPQPGPKTEPESPESADDNEDRPPTNPADEKAADAAWQSDDEIAAGYGQSDSGETNLDADKAATLATTVHSDKGSAEGGSSKKPALNASERNKQLIADQLDALRGDQGWNFDAPLEPNAHKWFSPARRQVKANALVPILKWLVKKGVNIMEPEEVATALGHEGYNGKDGKLVMKLFTIMGIPHDDANHQTEILTALRWKKGFSPTAYGKGGRVGTSDITKPDDDVADDGHDPYTDEPETEPESKPDADELMSLLGGGSKQSSKGGEQSSEPEALSPPKREAPPSPVADEPDETPDFSGFSGPPEGFKLPGVDYGDDEPATASPANYASYGGDDDGDDDERMSPDEISNIKLTGDPDETDADMSKLIQSIEDDDDREIAQTQWSKLKDRISAGEIRQDDAEENLDAIKSLAMDMAHYHVPGKVLREMLHNERFLTHLKAKKSNNKLELFKSLLRR